MAGGIAGPKSCFAVVTPLMKKSPAQILVVLVLRYPPPFSLNKIIKQFLGLIQKNKVIITIYQYLMISSSTLLIAGSPP